MSRLVSRAAFALLLTGALAGMSVSPAAEGAPPPMPDVTVAQAANPASAALTQRLIRDLKQDGFEVTVGYPKLYEQSDCDAYTYPVMENCYGNNPAAPYVMPVVKAWPDEYVDPATVNAFGKTRPGYSATYRLDPREAIVVLGELPPQGRYLGLQSWVFSKEWLTPESPWNVASQQYFAAVAPDLVGYLFGTVPPNPSRVQSFSSLSNNINNVVIEGQSGAAFGQTRYFVITPDQAMDRSIRAALGRVGVVSDVVFTEPIPAADELGSIGPIGLDADANDFVTLMRYAMPEDQRAAMAWRKSLPLTVLRIRQAPSSDRLAEPYSLFVADPRSAVPESTFAPALNQLVGSICDRAASGPWNLDVTNSGCEGPAVVPSSVMIDLVNDLGQFGPECRSIGMNCLGDGQDASYFLAKSRALDEGQVYAVVGTLATQTGNGTYVGLSVNDVSTLKGVANIPDTDASDVDGDLTGSAAIFESGGQDFDPFFVHFFTRDCSAIDGLTGGACTSITEDMVPRAGDPTAPGDPDLLGKFSAAVRAYVKPGTARGPDPALQLRPRILTFTLP